MIVSKGERIFKACNLVFLVLLAMICLLPFIYIISLSFSSLRAVTQNRVFLWPVEFQTDGYRMAFRNPDIVRSFFYTVFLTVLGTFLSLCATTTTAYPLSKHRLHGRKQILFFITFTMLFSGGMIPTLLVVKSTGLLNTIWSMILPILISPYNLLIMRTYFQTSIPSELEEAAIIDGCGTFAVFIRIVLPVSKAILATMTVYYAVSYWNTFMYCLLYITDSSKITLQVRLRQLVMLGMTDQGMEMAETMQVTSETLKAATIIITVLPIMLVYPWLQKYFVKGVMIGSLKG